MFKNACSIRCLLVFIVVLFIFNVIFIHKGKAEEYKDDRFDEAKVTEEMRKLFPDEVTFNTLKSCVGVFFDPNQLSNQKSDTEECTLIMKECIDKCKEKKLISNDCLYELFEEDFYQWVKGDGSSLTELIIEEMKNKLKVCEDISKLKGLKIFNMEPLPETCIDQYKKYPFCGGSYIFFDMKNIKKGKQSIFIELFNKKLAIFNNFKSTDGFKKTKWGMNKEEVKAIEKLKLIKESDDLLIYKDKILSFDTNPIYNFVFNKLVLVTYYFEVTHMNFEEYISDYSKIKKLLISKYGAPHEEMKNWKNNLYKGNPEAEGLCISMGHLDYYTYWDIDKTRIAAILTGDNFKIKHYIVYRSKELELLDKKAQEIEAENSL